MQVSKSAAILGEDAERLSGCRFDAEAHERLALSLENFDPDAQEEPFLTSPRSLEACLRQGITPQDLVRRPFEYYVRGNEPRLRSQLRAERAERRRQQRMYSTMDERDAIISEAGPLLVLMEEQQRNRHAHGNAASQAAAAVKAREEAAMQKTLARQAGELQAALTTAMLQEAAAARAAEVEAKAEAARQADAKRRRQAAKASAAHKRAMESKRAAAQAAAERRAAEEQALLQRKLQRQAEEEEAAAAAARKAAAARERELQAKRKAAEDAAAERHAALTAAAEAKEREIAEREAARQAAKRREAAAAKAARTAERRAAEKRIRAVRQAAAEAETQRRRGIERRSQQAEERLDAWKTERQRALRRRAQQAAEAEAKRKAALAATEQRAAEWRRSVAEATQEKLQRAAAFQEAAREAAAKRAAHSHKDAHVAAVRASHERAQAERRRALVETIAAKEERVEAARAAAERDAAERRQLAALREEEAAAALQRKRRQDAYKRLKTAVHLEEVEHRAEERRIAKRAASAARAKAAEAMERKKNALLQQLTSLKGDIPAMQQFLAEQGVPISPTATASLSSSARRERGSSAVRPGSASRVSPSSARTKQRPHSAAPHRTRKRTSTPTSAAKSPPRAGTWRVGGGKVHYRTYDGISQPTLGWGDGLRGGARNRHTGTGAHSSPGLPAPGRHPTSAGPQQASLHPPSLSLPWLQRPRSGNAVGTGSHRRSARQHRSAGYLAHRAGASAAEANLLDMGPAPAEGGAVSTRWAPYETDVSAKQYPLGTAQLADPTTRITAKAQHLARQRPTSGPSITQAHALAALKSAEAGQGAAGSEQQAAVESAASR